MKWGVLDDEGHSARPFAADEQTLQDAQEHEQHRRCEADGGVGRQGTDEAGDDADSDDRDHENLAPADLVADAAEDETADGTCGEPDAEGREGRQRSGGGILAGEVLHVEDKGRSGTEEEEVIPFERGAQQGSERDLIGILDAEFMRCGVLRCSCGVVVTHVSLHRGQGWVL